MYYAYKYLAHRKYVVLYLGIVFFILSFLLTSLNIYDSTNKFYINNLNFDKEVNVELTYKGNSDSIEETYAGLKKSFSTMEIDQNKVYYYETLEVNIPIFNDPITLVGLADSQVKNLFSNGEISEVTYDTFNTDDSVIISEDMVEQYGINVGDTYNFDVKNSLVSLPENVQLKVGGVINIPGEGANFYTSVKTVERLSQLTGVSATKKVDFSVPTTNNFIKIVEKKLSDPNFLQVFSFKVQNPLFNEVVAPLYLKYTSLLKEVMQLSFISFIVISVMFYFEFKRRINEVKLVYLTMYSLKKFFKSLLLSTTLIGIFFITLGTVSSLAYNYHELNHFAMKSRNLDLSNFDLSIFDSIDENILNLDIDFNFLEAVIISFTIVLIANILRIIIVKYTLRKVTFDV